MLALTAAAMTLGFASCSDNNDPTPDDSSAKDAKFEAIAKQYLANTVNITYQNLADKTELLVDQLKALRADKTDANVRTACKTFLEARAWWEKYWAQNEAYMSRSAEKRVRGLCFNELGVGG